MSVHRVPPKAVFAQESRLETGQVVENAFGHTLDKNGQNMVIRLHLGHIEGQILVKLEDVIETLATCRNFTEICHFATVSGLSDVRFSGTLLASIDADARIRELGRYGIVGQGPSKESVALSGKGLIAQAMRKANPSFIPDLLKRAEENLLTPESDIDELVRINGFQSAYVIPLVDQNYLYGVLGLVSTEPYKTMPSFQFDYQMFQALFGMAVRSVAFRNPKKPSGQDPLLADLSIREQTVLALLAQDKSNQEIAEELNVSISTVKAGVSEVLQKLQVSSRKQAGIKARYSGLH
jgi:DNA-binding CsgD family transcriptional regulator